MTLIPTSNAQSDFAQCQQAAVTPPMQSICNEDIVGVCTGNPDDALIASQALAFIMSSITPESAIKQGNQVCAGVGGTIGNAWLDPIEVCPHVAQCEDNGCMSPPIAPVFTSPPAAPSIITTTTVTATNTTEAAILPTSLETITTNTTEATSTETSATVKTLETDIFTTFAPDPTGIGAGDDRTEAEDEVVPDPVTTSSIMTAAEPTTTTIDDTTTTIVEPASSMTSHFEETTGAKTSGGIKKTTTATNTAIISAVIQTSTIHHSTTAMIQTTTSLEPGTTTTTEPMGFADDDMTEFDPDSTVPVVEELPITPLGVDISTAVSVSIPVNSNSGAMTPFAAENGDEPLDPAALSTSPLLAMGDDEVGEDLTSIQPSITTAAAPVLEPTPTPPPPPSNPLTDQFTGTPLQELYLPRTRRQQRNDDKNNNSRNNVQKSSNSRGKIAKSRSVF